MTKKKTARPMSWWVDETVPDIASALPAGIDVEAFTAWLGPVLGEYRSANKMRDGNSTLVRRDWPLFVKRYIKLAMRARRCEP